MLLSPLWLGYIPILWAEQIGGAPCKHIMQTLSPETGAAQIRSQSQVLSHSLQRLSLG